MVYIQIGVIIALTLSGFEISLFCLFAGALSTHYNNFEFYSGIDFIITQLCHTNGSMESVCPWELRTYLEILNVGLQIILETLRICSSLLQVLRLLCLSKNVMFTEVFYTCLRLTDSTQVKNRNVLFVTLLKC